jgi:hypothetical protein
MTPSPDVDEVLGRLLPSSAGAKPAILARLWATVDTDRAIADLISAGPRGAVPRRLADDPLLGAAVTLLAPPAGDPGAIPVAVVEPNTVGRLAATLARHGEGDAGRYVAAPAGLRSVRSRAAGLGIRVSRTESGPFGPSLLVLEWPVGGPHLLIVDLPTGTIAR